MFGLAEAELGRYYCGEERGTSKHLQKFSGFFSANLVMLIAERLPFIIAPHYVQGNQDRFFTDCLRQSPLDTHFITGGRRPR